MDGSIVARIGRVLSEAFGVPCVLASIEPSQYGANRRSHYIAKTEDRRTFSLKCATRMGDAPADRNEYLSHHLAELIGIRGHSSARRLTPIPELGGVFAQRSVIAIQWYSSTALHLDKCVASIAASKETFLHQLGSWAGFTTMIGASNRSQENVLWDAATGTLGHCDFEDAFRAQDTLQEQLQFARTYGGLTAGSWISNVSYAPGLALASGLSESSDLLQSRRSEIVSAMEDEGVDAPAKATAVEWIDLPLEKKIQRARDSVG